MDSKQIPKLNEEILSSFKLLEWTAKSLPIRFFGDEVLKSRCQKVTKSEFGTDALNTIINTTAGVLAKYRAHTGMGRGIAANQVGYSKRIVVVWLNNKPEVLINPRMISSQGIGSYWESCISSGTLLIGEIHRPWKGIFEYQDKKGRSRRLEADEKQTRVLLHEIDHLNGIVCTERYEPRTTSFVHGGKEEILSYELRRIDI